MILFFVCMYFIVMELNKITDSKIYIEEQSPK